MECNPPDGAGLLVPDLSTTTNVSHLPSSACSRQHSEDAARIGDEHPLVCSMPAASKTQQLM